MSQRNNSRIERFAQMSKQEELIAKKRQEILEKQRTTELAKAVAAAQSLAAKLKTSEDCLQLKEKSDEDVTDNKTSDVESNPSTTTVTTKSLNTLTGKIGKTVNLKRQPIVPVVAEHPPSKIQNTFCNDGSFLENFKKILEKQQQPHPLLAMCQQMNVNASSVNSETTHTNTTATSGSSSMDESNIAPLMTLTATNSKVFTPQVATSVIPPPPTPPNPVQFAFNPALMTAPNLLLPQTVSDANSSVPPPPMSVHAAAAYYATTAPAPPPPPTTVAAAVAAAAMLMPMHAVTAATAPPPPPPPQMPQIQLSNIAPLYMIPAPQPPLQLNTIPQATEYDLNPISNDKANLDPPSHIPNTMNDQLIFHQQQQQNQEQQQQQQQQQHEQQQQQQENEQYTIELNSSSSNSSSNNNSTSSADFHQRSKLIQLDSENSNTNLQENTSNQHISHMEQSKNSDEDNTANNANDIDGMPIQMPTTLENLIDLVADKGDTYEETLRSHKDQLHPAMWFLCDKNGEQYLRYRQQVIDRRKENLKEQQKQEAIEKEMMKSTLSHKQRQTSKGEMEEDKYDPESVISGDNDSDDEYRRGILDRNRDNIKRRIECRNELAEEERQEREAAELESLKCKEKKKLRKSRWGGKVEMANSSLTSSVPTSFGNQNKPLLSTITNNDPALLQYAKLNYGSTNLSEEEWNKCKEHYKVNLLYQDMMRKRQEIDRLAHSGKFKYEYDSDEDVDGGTWEHKLRLAEMEATKAWAQALTKQSEGKHHIGDFLPPEELKKFMEQYEAKKYNRQPDLSDYKEYKLRADNKGFQMLQKLGWKEGQGLGQDGEGIVEPINKGPQREGNQGLGVQNSATPEECDNEYDAYRKRMMLAYRFRPNPLNNPRRAYY